MYAPTIEPLVKSTRVGTRQIDDVQCEYPLASLDGGEIRISSFLTLMGILKSQMPTGARRGSRNGTDRNPSKGDHRRGVNRGTCGGAADDSNGWQLVEGYRRAPAARSH